MPCACYAKPNPPVGDDSDALPLQQALAAYLHRRKFWRAKTIFDETHAGALKVVGSRAPEVIDRERDDWSESPTFEALAKLGDRDGYHLAVTKNALVFTPAKTWRKNPSRRVSALAGTKVKLRDPMSAKEKAAHKATTAREHAGALRRTRSALPRIRALVERLGLTTRRTVVRTMSSSTLRSDYVWVTDATRPRGANLAALQREAQALGYRADAFPGHISFEIPRNATPTAATTTPRRSATTMAKRKTARKTAKKTARKTVARKPAARKAKKPASRVDMTPAERRQKLAASLRNALRNHVSFRESDLKLSVLKNGTVSVRGPGGKKIAAAAAGHNDVWRIIAQTSAMQDYLVMYSGSWLKFKPLRANPTFRRTKDGKVIATAPSSGRTYSVKGEGKKRASKFMNARKAAIARGEKPKSRKRLPSGGYQTVGSSALMLRWGRDGVTGGGGKKKAKKRITKREMAAAMPPQLAAGGQVDAFTATVGPFVVAPA